MDKLINLIDKFAYAIKLDNQAIYNIVKTITKEFVQSAKADVSEMKNEPDQNQETFKSIFENLYKNIWSGKIPVKNLTNENVESLVDVYIVGESTDSWQYTLGGLAGEKVTVKINLTKVFEDLWNDKFKVIIFANQLQKTLSHELAHMKQWPMNEKESDEYSRSLVHVDGKPSKAYFNSRIEVEAELSALLSYLETSLRNGKITTQAVIAIENGDSFEDFVTEVTSYHPMLILDQNNIYYESNVRKIWKLIFQFFDKNSPELINQLKDKIDPELLDSESRVKLNLELKKINSGKQIDFVSFLRNILSK